MRKDQLPRIDRAALAGHHRGFTLIELMTVLVISAVLLTVAVPNLVGFISSSRLRSAENELAASLSLARSEAVKRGATVYVTGPVASAGNEFGGGWNVWVDLNGNSTLDTGETIRSYSALPTGYTAKTDGGQQQVAFSSSGFLSPPTAVIFSLCTANSNQGFTVMVEPSGLTDVQSKTCP